MFVLSFTEHFLDAQKKLTKNNSELKKKLKKGLIQLAKDPRYTSLKTHKVETKSLGIKFSSHISDDIRVIREFDENNILCILLLDIGGHSGSKKVYR